MGCASSLSVSLTNEAPSNLSLKENNSNLSLAPVLRRPRNFQWYWTLTKNEEQWQTYTDIENEIIEDAYNENTMKKVEISKNCIIDFEHFIQYGTNDFHQQIRIKRMQLDRNHTIVYLRNERFGNQIILANSSLPSMCQEEPLPKRYWKLELENKIKTMADLTEDAALGIIKTGTSIGKGNEARWLAKQLLAVKHFGDDVKAHYSLVPKEIGQTCVYLYTKESFWYKSIYNFFRRQETVTIEQLKTYAPFCYLMHWYLKKNFSANTVTTVYRSLDLNDEQRMQFKKANIKFTAFTSSTKSRQNAERFGNTLLIIHLNGGSQSNEGEEDISCGADITTLSNYPDEQEFLIWPGSEFCFLKEEYDEMKHRYIIYLQALHNHFI